MLKIRNSLKESLYSFALELLRKPLRKRFASEKLYIFGTGPSLKYMDLRRFNDRPVFALNYLIFHRYVLDLDVRNCFITEPYYFYPIRNISTAYPGTKTRFYLNKSSFLYRKFITTNSEIDFHVNLSNFPALGLRNNIFYQYFRFPDEQFRFSKECWDAGIDPFGGSLSAAITYGIFYGFKEITLVGCDYTHTDPLMGAFYTESMGRAKAQPCYLKGFFEIVKKYISIQSLVLNGETFNVPHIVYEEYTGHRPRPHCGQIISPSISKILISERP